MGLQSIAVLSRSGIFLRMTRVLLLICLAAAGCAASPPAAPGPTPGPAPGPTPDTGPTRERAQALLTGLAQADTPADEAAATAALLGWLDEHDLGLQVETRRDGERIAVEPAQLASGALPATTTLACPYFPPVTPWVERTWLDPANLRRLRPAVGRWAAEVGKSGD